MDPDYLEAYTKKLEKVAVNSANNTEGALAVYIRFNPEFAPPTSGLFWSKTTLNGQFQQLTPTDFSSYSPTDVEHVGWYYIPVKNGATTWMSPYLNQNINTRMISYVIPLYVGMETVGVVGMGIDFGDMLIIDACKLICKTFSHSPAASFTSHGASRSTTAKRIWCLPMCSSGPTMPCTRISWG